MGNSINKVQAKNCKNLAYGKLYGPGTDYVDHPSEKLFENIRKLSDVSSICAEQRKKAGYDDKRNVIIKKIKQNLEDGANIYHYGNNNSSVYNSFQLAYVLDQDEVTEMMIPCITKNRPPYYNFNYLPFLTHAYVYRGIGNFYKSTAPEQFSFSISENIYKKYLDVASDAEKKDLEDYKNKVGKYKPCDNGYSNIRKYYTDLCYEDNPGDANCLKHIHHYLNTDKFVPPEFRS